jgi:hypothetical protein
MAPITTSGMPSQSLGKESWSIPVSEVLWRNIPVFQTRKASIFIAILHATCTRPLAKYPNIPQAKVKYSVAQIPLCREGDTAILGLGHADIVLLK